VDYGHKVDFHLAHHVDVSEAISYLAQQLHCNSWYVACHHEHLFVFRLAQGSSDHYAVRVECNAPVEKGVYHGSRARSFSISPLHNEVNLTDKEVSELHAGLAGLK
jgi:hypothetical protein